MLKIFDCPRIDSLFEKVLADSLVIFEIEHCPKLNSMSKKLGYTTLGCLSDYQLPSTTRMNFYIPDRSLE